MGPFVRAFLRTHPGSPEAREEVIRGCYRYARYGDETATGRPGAPHSFSSAVGSESCRLPVGGSHLSS